MKNSQQESRECQNQKEENAQSELLETGSLTAEGKHRIHCLTVIGQIEGHYVLPEQNKTTRYEHMLPQLVEVEHNPQIEGLLLLLNTVGGDVEAGLAIAEMIAGMSKPSVSLVLGGGHSIGVPLAVSTKCSFIVPSATMTLHPVRLSGLVLGAPQTFSYFERMQERIADFVTAHSRMEKERFMELTMKTGELAMDIGSILDGESAVQEGLIGRLGGLSDAMKALDRMIEAGKQQTEE